MLAAMSTDQGPRKAKSLTQEEFASFLLWLSEDHEQAARKYLEIRLKLVKFFVRKGCAHAEETADRTLDRAALIVHADPAKYSSPIALCCGVARKVWLEYLREVAPETLKNEELPAPTGYNAASGERDVICLESCLQELSARDARGAAGRFRLPRAPWSSPAGTSGPPTGFRRRTCCRSPRRTAA